MGTQIIPPDPGEQEYLKQYNPADYPRPSVTVDLVIFTIIDTDLKLLAIKRKEHPFKGQWSLPGGFVRVGEPPDQGENLEDAAHRELAEETGLPKGSAYLEQLHTFGNLGRDPRMRVISVAYFALVRPDLASLAVAGTDASDVDWFSVSHLLPHMWNRSATSDTLPSSQWRGTVRQPKLAFDHIEILEMAINRLRERVEISAFAFDLVPPTFTISELRSVYEVINNTSYDPSNFRRKIKHLIEKGILRQAEGMRKTGSKGAKVYQFIKEA